MKFRFFLMFFAAVMAAFCAIAPAPKTHNPVKKLALKVQWKVLKTQLKGNTKEWDRANVKLASMGWRPIQTKKELEILKSKDQLVPLPVNRYLSIDDEAIPARRRVTTPGFNRYLTGASLQLRVPLLFKSGARSAEDQDEIREENGNAARSKGKRISSHLFGLAVDFGYKDMPLSDCVKFAKFLLREKRKGVLQVALEKGSQLCFHIVYLAERPLGSKPTPSKPSNKKKAGRQQHAASFSHLLTLVSVKRLFLCLK